VQDWECVVLPAKMSVMRFFFSLVVCAPDEMIEEVGRFVRSLWICVSLFYFIVDVDPFSLIK